MPSRTVTTRNYASYQPVSAAEPQSSDQETTALQTIDLLDDSDDDVDYQLRMGGKSGTTRVPQRRWEIHPGKNKFSCQGRIVMAKQTGIFLFTVTLICLTSALWFVFDAPYLARRLSLAIPITGGVMFLYVLSTLLRTSFMDPGIIPRAKPDEAKDLEKQFGLESQQQGSTYRPMPRTREILVNEVPVKIKYCFTCKIFRPPRVSHCAVCDNCVERFDHHCPWVGNCVGKRNYRFFYMFISSLAFYCVFVFVCTVTHIALLVYDKEQKFIDAVKESPTSILVAAICFLSVWSILGLTGFHTYLVLGNQTTNEDIKGSFVSRRASNGQPHNPYRSPHGPCGNCCAVLCGPFYPSVLNATELLGSDWSENQPGGDSMRYGTVTTTQPQPPTAQVTTEKPGNSNGLNSRGADGGGAASSRSQPPSQRSGDGSKSSSRGYAWSSGKWVSSPKAMQYPSTATSGKGKPTSGSQDGRRMEEGMAERHDAVTVLNGENAGGGVGGFLNESVLDSLDLDSIDETVATTVSASSSGQQPFLKSSLL